MARSTKGKTTSSALLVALSAVSLLLGGAFVKAAEEGGCSVGSGEDACQPPATTERATEAETGGLFGDFSFGSLTGLFGGGEMTLVYISTEQKVAAHLPYLSRGCAQMNASVGSGPQHNRPIILLYTAYYATA